MLGVHPKAAGRGGRHSAEVAMGQAQQEPWSYRVWTDRTTPTLYPGKGTSMALGFSGPDLRAIQGKEARTVGSSIQNHHPKSSQPGGRPEKSGKVILVEPRTDGTIGHVEIQT